MHFICNFCIFKRILSLTNGKQTIKSQFNKLRIINKIIVNHQLQSSKMTEPAATATEQLNLKVKSQDGEEVFFKIKSSTQLKKLMDAYCQRQSLNSSNVRFLFDGERLHETQTPKDLNMENGDEIDVVIEQVGGKMI